MELLGAVFLILVYNAFVEQPYSKGFRVEIEDPKQVKKNRE